MKNSKILILVMLSIALSINGVELYTEFSSFHLFCVIFGFFLFVIILTDSILDAKK